MGESAEEASRLKLQGFLPYRLSVLSNAVSRAVAERYQAQFGISIWQWRVMAVVGETPGLSASDVVRRTQMDKVAVSRAVAALIETGLMRREAVQADGRRSQLQLTSQGRDIYARIVPAALDIESRLTADIDPDDMACFSRVMALIAARAAPDEPLW